jgi:hypothetical protein
VRRRNGDVKMRNRLWTEEKLHRWPIRNPQLGRRWEKKEIGEISDCVLPGGNRITILASGGI